MTLTPQQSLFKRISTQCKRRKEAYIDCMSRKLKGASKRGSFTAETKKKGKITPQEILTIRNVALLTPFTFFVGGGMIQLYKIMFNIGDTNLTGTLVMIGVGITGLFLMYKFVIHD